MSKQDSYTVQELFSELRRFEDELRQAGKQENTTRTYVDRSAIFIRWLAGDYQPNEVDRHRPA